MGEQAVQRLLERIRNPELAVAIVCHGTGRATYAKREHFQDPIPTSAKTAHASDFVEQVPSDRSVRVPGLS
jgi:hypothetical protein